MLITSRITPAKTSPLLCPVYRATYTGYVASSVYVDNYAATYLRAKLRIVE
jgi:hypothetical protein